MNKTYCTGKEGLLETGEPIDRSVCLSVYSKHLIPDYILVVYVTIKLLGYALAAQMSVKDLSLFISNTKIQYHWPHKYVYLLLLFIMRKKQINK